jgi:hypothetical protein
LPEARKTTWRAAATILAAPLMYSRSSEDKVGNFPSGRARLLPDMLGNLGLLHGLGQSMFIRGAGGGLSMVVIANIVLDYERCEK